MVVEVWVFGVGSFDLLEVVYCYDRVEGVL